MSILDQFEEVKKDKKALLLSNYFNIDFDWNDGVDVLNEASSNTSNQEIMSSFEQMGFNIKGSLGNKLVSYFQSLFGIPSKYSDIDHIVNKLYNELGYTDNVPNNHQLFTNLTGSQYVTYKHKDNWGVMYLQLLGQTKWNIYTEESLDNPIQTFTMNKGDVVIFDKGVYHEVSAETPRMALSCSLPGGLSGVYQDYID
jgi:hypothetical protein